MIQAILVLAVFFIIMMLGPNFVGLGIWFVMGIAVGYIIKSGIRKTSKSTF